MGLLTGSLQVSFSQKNSKPKEFTLSSYCSIYQGDLLFSKCNINKTETEAALHRYS